MDSEGETVNLTVEMSESKTADAPGHGLHRAQSSNNRMVRAATKPLNTGALVPHDEGGDTEIEADIEIRYVAVFLLWVLLQSFTCRRHHASANASTSTYTHTHTPLSWHTEVTEAAA